MVNDEADGGAVTTVGVFDSGVGGLTVTAAIHRLMPALPIRYLADTAHFPYGERSDAAVEARACALAERLVDEGCALLVVACNTASSAALERLRRQFAVPIVGMEPPLKPAAERTRSGRIAVLATPATSRGARLRRLTDAYAAGAEVEALPLPGLADLVEAGEVTGERVERSLREALSAAIERGVDEVALGCTHYGFLRPVLERLLPPGIEVLDAAEPVARRVAQQLEEHDLPLPQGAEVPVACSTTGDLAAFEAVLERLRSAGAELPPLRFVDG